MAKRETTIARWFSDCSKQLLEYVRSKISDYADAEDLAQDVWAQVTNLASIDEVEEAGAWIYTVARNRITDFYRKKKTIALSTLEGDDDEELFFEAEGLPSEMVESKEFWEIFYRALDELPKEQRDVFIEHEMNDVSFKELSARTGVPINTLLARKRYATLKLRSIFEQLETN